jgi:hypothetical protein
VSFEQHRFHQRARAVSPESPTVSLQNPCFKFCCAVARCGSPGEASVNERRRPVLRTIEGGASPSGQVISLATFLPWRKRALRAERHAARLMRINKRLLLMPADLRARVNFSNFDSALQIALDASDYEFGLFVSRYTGG